MQCSLAVPAEIIVQQTLPVSRAITKNTSNTYNVAPTPNYVKLLPKTDPTFNPKPIHTAVESTRTFQDAQPVVNWTNEYLSSAITNQQASIETGEAIPCAVKNIPAGINAKPVARIITLPTSANVTDNIGVYTSVQAISSNSVETQNRVQGIINPGVSAAPKLEVKSIPKPKIKRKRTVLAPSQPPIHLLKTGETYRSLEKLDDDKLKLITNALMRIGDPLTSKKKSVFDGATKTRVKYRVIYPEDFDISETSQITIKGLDKQREPSNRKTQCQAQNVDMPQSNQQVSTDNSTVSSQSVSSNTEELYTDEQMSKEETQQQNTQEKAEVALKKAKYKRKKKNILVDDQEYDVREDIVKVTRSGRTVKRPKGRKHEEVQKPKFRKLTYVDVLTCLYCHEKFHGVAKLNRHYETYPTHKPNHTHTNLFQCFLGIMKDTPASEKSYTFIEQLESLIVKIKNMLPCMINNIDSNDGKLCCINEDLGRMLEMEPGKYNISFEEAIRCYENKHAIGHCKHLMRTNLNSSDLSKPSQLWVAKHNEEIALMENQELDCARTNSIDKWPSIKKRIKRYIPISKLNENNQSPSQNVDVTTINQNEEVDPSINTHSQTANIWIRPKNAKIGTKNRSLLKMLGSGPIPILNLDGQPKHVDQINVSKNSQQAPLVTKENVCIAPNKSMQTQNTTHLEQFQSAHFDVRSSPIKASNTSFNKIQIKDNSPLLIKLANDHTSSNADTSNEPVQKSKVSNIQLDLSGMFPEMNNKSVSKPSNPTLPQTTAREQIKLADLYDSQSGDQLEPMRLDMDANEKGYAVPLSANSTSYCDISQNSIGQNDRFLSSGITEIILLSSSTDHISQNDRLLSSGNLPDNQNDLLSSGNTLHNDHLLSSGNDDIRQNNHILSSRNQNDCLFSNGNSQMVQNNLLSSENAHTSQSDRLLSSGNAAISQNDRLLSSGNVPISQSDTLVNMCVNESNLEGSRMGLQLLDHLGTDCLSFTDTELRNASLDLPLDLFPFNNTE